jgi:hypothetical protein
LKPISAKPIGPNLSVPGTYLAPNVHFWQKIAKKEQPAQKRKGYRRIFIDEQG